MAGERPAKERLFYLERQQVDLSNFECKGRILDIGGGGEGIIGQLFLERVVAIDSHKGELLEAAEGPLKIVMDAQDLQFLDQSFDTVTGFFVMMYIPQTGHRKVFEEALRVLKPGGELHLWDLTIPKWPGGVQDIYVLPLNVQLPDQLVQTGYGTLWAEREQNLAYFKQLLGEVGFICVEEITTEDTFYIKAQKA